MNFDEFTGQAQHRLELANTGQTVRAIRATLMTLGERIPADNADDIAASLPMEIDWYMTEAVADHGQRFDWHEYVDRVSAITGADPSDAAYQAQLVVDLLCSVAPDSDVQQLRDELPESPDAQNWGKLFAVVDSGGWSDARERQTGGGPQPTAEEGSESGDE
jgi:uncharacterized protein (DUF2267 family)